MYSASWELQLVHVKTVFGVLKHHQFFVKLKKCTFRCQKLEYLGHIITSEGVKVDQQKIQAMLEWSRLTMITELRGLLGFTGMIASLYKTME